MTDRDHNVILLGCGAIAVAICMASHSYITAGIVILILGGAGRTNA